MSISLFDYVEGLPGPEVMRAPGAARTPSQKRAPRRERGARAPQGQHLTDITRRQAALTAGESYEACLTVQIHTDVSFEPFGLFRTLRRRNLAFFAAYLKLDGVTAPSSSPDRFLAVERDRPVQTRPTKGSARPCAGPARDVAQRTRLPTDETTSAEHLTIVDLPQRRVSYGRHATGRNHDRRGGRDRDAVGSEEELDGLLLEAHAPMSAIAQAVTGNDAPEAWTGELESEAVTTEQWIERDFADQAESNLARSHGGLGPGTRQQLGRRPAKLDSPMSALKSG